MNVALFITISLALLFGVEILKRRLKTSHELSRRLAHIGAGIINIMAPLFVSHQAIILVNVVFTLLLLAGRNTQYFSSIQAVKRKTYGDVYFPLGIIIAATVLLPEHTQAFQYGVAIMGISDALAGLIGETWGKKIIVICGTPKTRAGALAFYISSFIITAIFAPHVTPLILVLPLILTVVEFVLVFGLDNLVLPVVSGLLFLLFF